MKKATWFVSVLLSAALTVSSFAGMLPSAFSGVAPELGVSVSAEEDYEEEDYEEYDEGSDEGDSEEYHFEQDPTVDSNAIKGWPQGDPVDADAAVVMDAKTGTILYSKHMDDQKYPASITKIMTVLLALENGNLEDVVKFSDYAVYSIEFGSAHLGLTEGEELTLEQCLYGIMLASANEISNAVAEYVAGDVDEFAKMMNAKAKALGCKNTHFVNPNGLHEEDHYVSAKDMALITQEALKYDKFREIINTDEYHYPPTNLCDEDRYFVNHHQMLMEESYDGIIGGKTGFTDQAFNTLVTCAERDDMTLIAVVLHAPGIESEYGDTRTILDYGFDNFEQVDLDLSVVATMNPTIVGIDDEAEVAKIQAADYTKAPFEIADTITLTVPKGTNLSKVKVRMNFKKGKMNFFFNGEKVGSTDLGYTGDWEPETEAATETEIASEGDVEGLTGDAAGADAAGETGISESEDGLVLLTEEGSVAIDPTAETDPGSAPKEGFMAKVEDFIETMRQGFAVIAQLLEGNDMISAIIGGILLIIFIPILILTISRNIRYKKMMRLRQEEMEERKQLEEEIERKTAAQIEAELRARELEFQLEMERKKNSEENSADSKENGNKKGKENGNEEE